MLKEPQDSFRELISALQVARLYPNWHPAVKKAIEKAYSSLSDYLTENDTLILGIIGEELAFEKEIFFDLSSTVKPIIQYLKAKGIERLTFNRGVTLEELHQFISSLISAQEETGEITQELLSLSGIKNIVIGKIKASNVASTQKLSKAVHYLKLYDDSLGKVTDSLESVLNGKELDKFNLHSTMRTVMDNLLGKHQNLLNFAAVKRYDLRTFSHFLNVSILSMYFTSRLGFNLDEVNAIGVAALFHDIGKLYISRKIIRKPAKLTEDEFDKIRNHVILGAEILLKYTDDLGILPVVVCFEHHIKYDLSGYPKVPLYQKPHVASLLISICDVYDALSARRSYKTDYPPPMIYDIMMRDKGKAFEPQLLDKFFTIMGVWPEGTIVFLSDGRVAAVKEENADDIFSPKVQILIGEDVDAILDLKVLKDRLKIERYLNPFTEGKDYLERI